MKYVLLLHVPFLVVFLNVKLKLNQYQFLQLVILILSLPYDVLETHVSLFDGSNCGIRVKDRPIFSVQHHPEASPGPQDSYYLFERFAAAMATR